MPGGAVNVGEDLHIAAERKTLEETGVEIHVKGILRSEYTPMSNGFRVRTVFYAEVKTRGKK